MLALVLAYARSAGAEDTARTRHAAAGDTPAGSGREAAFEAMVEKQDAALRERTEEITAVGRELERAQARADDAGARVVELGQQTKQLERQTAEQDRLFRQSREDYRARIRAAYKGESLEGFVAFLGGWFGPGRGAGVMVDPSVTTVLLENRQNIVWYGEAGRDLRNTRRQILQKRADYRDAYNHAEWYVKKVLAVAEAYRRLAHDERVGPYV